MRIKINDYDCPYPTEVVKFIKENPRYYKPEVKVTEGNHINVAICEKCGNELYTKWTYYTSHFEYCIFARDVPDVIRQKANQLCDEYERKPRDICFQKDYEDKYCPICGNIIKLNSWFAQHIDDAMKKEYGSYEGKLLRSAQKESTQFVQICNLPVADRFVSNDALKSNPTELKKYIFHLLQLETNLITLSKHLENLYFERNKNERFVKQANYAPTIEAMHKKEAAQTKYNHAKEEYEKRLKYVASCRNNKPLPVKILEPVNKPAEPKYHRPGLFNKKKALAENELLKAKYLQDLEEYDQKCRQLAFKSKQQDQENQEKYLQNVQLAEAAAEKARLTMESSQVNPEDFIPGLPPEVCPAKAKQQMICTEIEKTEILLRDTYKARNELYAVNVIFPKYRDIVALATFYEYLMAGRCTELEGPNGTYNLYEAEIRANMIISKLSEIEKSLKTIEKNQFMIYSQLTEMNQTLGTISNTMHRAYQAISDIQVNTQDMAQHIAHISQNSDVIAHNTAVTAYYSKLNTELTNALGFMIALK